MTSVYLIKLDTFKDRALGYPQFDLISKVRVLFEVQWYVEHPFSFFDTSLLIVQSSTS